MSTKLNDNDDLVVNDDAEDNVSLVENSDNISANDNDDEMKDDDQTVTSVGLTIENPMNIEMTNIKNDDDNQVSKDDDEDDNAKDGTSGKEEENSWRGNNIDAFIIANNFQALKLRIPST